MRLSAKAFSMTAISVAIVLGTRQKSHANGPCDIYQAGGTPCVAAHSTVRALYGSYSGNLYQIKRASDKMTKDIGVLTPGGVANAVIQDQFCASTTCTISEIYDQSPKGNNLTSAPAGAFPPADVEAVATALKFMMDGHSVYGIYVTAGTGYRNDKTSGVATGDQPEGMYMVTSGTHYNDKCCFDYGNAETNDLDDGNGTMEAIYFGTCTGWGKGTGSGPWVMADLENGLFAGQSFAVQPTNTPLASAYVTAMVKGNSGNSFAIKGGNAQSGILQTMYSGARPAANGYNPMKKQGAIVLGIGGDNSHLAVGNFYEGCITSGYPSEASDAAVQANIVAAGYGSSTAGIPARGVGDSPASLRYDASASGAVIDYSLANAQHVRLQIVDVQGNEVARLLDGMVSAGRHQVVWNAKQAGSGLYALKMETEGRGAGSRRWSTPLLHW